MASFACDLFKSNNVFEPLKSRFTRLDDDDDDDYDVVVVVVVYVIVPGLPNLCLRSSSNKFDYTFT